MKIHSIKIKDSTFNLAECSAVNQKKLVNILGGRLIAGCSATDETINTTLLKATLITIEEVELDKVSDILLYKTFISGTDEKVDVNSFQGKMNDYFTLLAEAVKCNLCDFLEWLDSENEKERAKIS